MGQNGLAMGFSLPAYRNSTTYVHHSRIIRKVRTHFGFSILMLLVAAMPMIAQESTGEVNGRVISSRDSEPLARVDGQLAGTSLHAVTADDGTFQISGVMAGA